MRFFCWGADVVPPNSQTTKAAAAASKSKRGAIAARDIDDDDEDDVSGDEDDDDMDVSASGSSNGNNKVLLRNSVKMFCYLITLVVDSLEKQMKAGQELQAAAASVSVAPKKRGVCVFTSMHFHTDLFFVVHLTNSPRCFKP
jgi:hypothetical protein